MNEQYSIKYFKGYLILIPLLNFILIYTDELGVLPAYLHDNPSDYLVRSLLLLPFILTIISTHYNKNKNLIITTVLITAVSLFYLFLYFSSYNIIVDLTRQYVIFLTIPLMILIFILNSILTNLLDRMITRKEENK